jgi:hypothetical protein
MLNVRVTPELKAKLEQMARTPTQGKSMLAPPVRFYGTLSWKGTHRYKMGLGPDEMNFGGGGRQNRP